MNAAWHKANPMPRSPTLDQWMAWHVEHARECACRAIPPKLLAEMQKRGLMKDPKKINPRKN